MVRFTGIHYLEQPEIFFVNLKKNFVESGKGDADIIVLGDSRSMALAGYPKQPDIEFSVYNHSLPAMGPKYYRFFLDKYLKKGNAKPKMILFAASPKLYSTGYGPPLYDPDAKAVKENESVPEYLNRRWNEGIKKNFFELPLLQISSVTAENKKMQTKSFGSFLGIVISTNLHFPNYPISILV